MPFLFVLAIRWGNGTEPVTSVRESTERFPGLRHGLCERWVLWTLGSVCFM